MCEAGEWLVSEEEEAITFIPLDLTEQSLSAYVLIPLSLSLSLYIFKPELMFYILCLL